MNMRLTKLVRITPLAVTTALMLTVTLVTSAASHADPTVITTIQDTIGGEGGTGGGGDLGPGGAGGAAGCRVCVGGEITGDGGNGHKGYAGGTGGTGGTGGEATWQINETITSYATIILGGDEGHAGEQGITGKYSGAPGGSGGFANWPWFAAGTNGSCAGNDNPKCEEGAGSGETKKSGGIGKFGGGGGGGSSGPDGWAQYMASGGRGGSGAGGAGSTGQQGSTGEAFILDLGSPGALQSDEGFQLGGTGGRGGTGGQGGDGGGGGGGAGGGGNWGAGAGGDGGPPGDGGPGGLGGIGGAGSIELEAQGVLNNHGTITTGRDERDGRGTIRLNGQSVLNNHGSIEAHNRNSGMAIEGGHLVNANSISGLSLSVGLMSNEGQLTNSGALENYDYLHNSGVITNSGTISRKADPYGGFDHDAVAQIYNDSTGEITNTGILEMTMLRNQGVITNTGTGEMTISSSNFSENENHDSGRIVNTGNMKLESGVELNNGGEIENSGGTIENEGELHNHGTVVNGSYIGSRRQGQPHGKYQQDYGSTTLNQGVIEQEEVFIREGELIGAGTISAESVIIGGWADAVIRVGNDSGRRLTIDVSNGLNLSSGSIFEFELGGLVRGVSYDFLDINGELRFEGHDVGSVNVLWDDGFTASSGDSFDILDWDQDPYWDPYHAGSFAELNLPMLRNGLSWDTSAFNDSGILSVTGSAVPVPSALLLLLTGFIPLMAFARYKENTVH